LLEIIRKGNKELVQLYYSKGGNVHVMDKEKWNALHYSASSLKNQLETTKYLISVGVDYKANNYNGKTPLELAKQNKNMEIVQFLKEVEKK